MTLPGQPQLHLRDQSLYLEDVPLAPLAREHGTPLFVYSEGAMLAALASYQRGFEGRDALICYAMKANANLAILKLFVLSLIHI